MDVEEEAELEVEPRFGYGSLGRNEASLPLIPPNAKIVYNIVLKNVEMEPDMDTLPYSEKRRIGYVQISTCIILCNNSKIHGNMVFWSYFIPLGNTNSTVCIANREVTRSFSRIGTRHIIFSILMYY